MKKFIGVLLLIWAGGWFVSCAVTGGGTALDVQELGLGVVKGCEGEKGAAVSITLNQGNSQLIGLRIKYRINDGEWKPEVETNDIPFLITGPAGKYEIEVRKAGFPVQTAIVVVPQEENCGILQQELNLSIDQPACSSPESVVAINLTTEPPDEAVLDVVPNMIDGNEGNGLGIKLKTPNTQGNSICANRDSCQFNVELRDPGNYVVEFEGFPDQRKMMIIDNIVHYTYTGIKIEMFDEEQRKEVFVSEGVSKVSITIPYNYSDRICPEVLFDDVDIDTTHVQSSDHNKIETIEQLSLMIENYPSDKCAAPTSEIPVDFDVLLPAGTNISNVRVEYWLDNDWQQAGCTHTNGYQCTAIYPNPLHADKYQVRTLINDHEYLGTNISLGNKCIIFEALAN